jgi:hypothetical protein
MTVEQNTEMVAWNWDDFEIKVEDTGDIPVVIYRFLQKIIQYIHP